jgi:hypothetical protein
LKYGSKEELKCKFPVRTRKNGSREDEGKKEKFWAGNVEGGKGGSMEVGKFSSNSEKKQTRVLS